MCSALIDLLVGHFSFVAKPRYLRKIATIELMTRKLSPINHFLRPAMRIPAREGLSWQDCGGNPLKTLYSKLGVIAAQHLVVMKLDAATDRRDEQLSNHLSGVNGPTSDEAFLPDY